MPTFRLRPPIVIVDPARVDAWLAAHGYQVLDGSSIASDGSLIVNTDRDPSADVAAYQDAPTADELAVQQATAVIKSYVKNVLATAPASRTAEQRVIVALARVLMGIVDGS